jgi:hypothetical protein
MSNDYVQEILPELIDWIDSVLKSLSCLVNEINNLEIKHSLLEEKINLLIDYVNEQKSKQENKMSHANRNIYNSEQQEKPKMQVDRHDHFTVRDDKRNAAQVISRVIILNINDDSNPRTHAEMQLAHLDIALELLTAVKANLREGD